jgi:quinone-modifying oxidoreductase, subunit QmoC
MPESSLVEPDLTFIREVKRLGGETVKKCYQCATCSVVCNLSPSERPFPRKEMILAQWGQADRLIRDPDIWLCYQCNDCTTYCPRGARPGDVLAAIRSYIYEHYSFPSFMGRALANPRALPLLLLVPMVAILAMMLAFSRADFSFMTGEIEFAKFIPHGWIEGMFIGGNILIFLFAAIGLWRFWRGLHSVAGSNSGPGFFTSLVMTAKEIALHLNFGKCTANKPRYLAHALVLFGFIGAMITAGLAVLALMLFNFGSPIPLSHPIKWLGNASGLSGFIGLTILVYRRLTQKDRVGASGYPDWLFLVMLYLVFITGLLTQFLRLAETPVMAYSTYYIHLVIVFFLLWYAPYSKFAHMFYRTLALVYTRSIGRIVKT